MSPRLPWPGRQPKPATSSAAVRAERFAIVETVGGLPRTVRLFAVREQALSYIQGFALTALVLDRQTGHYYDAQGNRIAEPPRKGRG